MHGEAKIKSNQIKTQQIEKKKNPSLPLDQSAM